MTSLQDQCRLPWRRETDSEIPRMLSVSQWVHPKRNSVWQRGPVYWNFVSHYKESEMQREKWSHWRAFDKVIKLPAATGLTQLVYSHSGNPTVPFCRDSATALSVRKEMYVIGTLKSKLLKCLKMVILISKWCWVWMRCPKLLWLPCHLEGTCLRIKHMLSSRLNRGRVVLWAAECIT